MKTKTRLFILLYILFVSLVDAKSLYDAKPQQALIVNTSPTEPIFFYYKDSLLVQTNTHLSALDTARIVFDDNSFSPIMVFMPNETEKKVGLALMPGDTIYVKPNLFKRNYDYTGNQQVELDLLRRVGLSKFSLVGLFDEVAYGSKMPFAEFLDDWRKIWYESEKFIKELRAYPQVRPTVAAHVEKAIRLRVYSLMLIPVILHPPEKPIRPLSSLYQDTVQAHTKKLQLFNGSVENATQELIYAQRSYAIFLAASQGKYATFPEQYALAKKEYSGFQREWTCYSILSDCHRVNDDQVSALVKDYQSWVSPNSKFLKKLLEAEQLNQVAILSDSSLNDRLNTQESKLVKLFDTIESNKGKVIYIDFWASWCKPCLEELPVSAELREQYKYQDLVMIYLSVDKDKEKWQDASNRFLWNAKESYRFENEDDSRLLKKLNVQVIPRYMIIDKAGIIRYANAPRPSDPELKKILDKLLL